jgi:iron complex outermembrane receptor protein
VETGFRSGGFNLAAGYPIFKPEYITAYTIGSKNRFLDGRLQLNLEGFYWDYRDQQLAHVGLDKAGVQSLFTQNSGHTTNKGFDVDGRLLLTDTTALNGQLQYLDASYDTFSYQSPIGRLPPYVGCPFAPNPSSPGFYTINCKGKPSFNSPRWTFNIGLDQTVPLNNYKLVGTVDTHFLSSRYTGFDYVAGERVGTTFQTNLQVTFAPISDAWSLAAFVRNIEDNRYTVTSTEFGIGSAVVAVTAPPRTYGARATIKF